MTPGDCPPAEIKLMVNGQNINVTWWDDATDKERTVPSAGNYALTVVDNETGCPYEEEFSVSNDIFQDTDGDGVCDDKDCNPTDASKTYAKGDPCDDGNPCTINDKYDNECNCTGEIPQYGLVIELTGDNNICYSQETTTLSVEASGGTEPYDVLWSTGETSSSIIIKEISQGGGEEYSVTVTDATGCNQEESIELIRQSSDDTDGDGYCDDVDCAPYSAEIGGPGSPCDDGDPGTINDVHDENCNCAGTPNTNYIPITKDGVSEEFVAPQFVKSHPTDCDNSTGGTIVEQEPVAYVSGTKARVKACFLTDCTHSYYIRGLGEYISVNQTSVRIEFPKQMVTPSLGQVVYDWRDASIPFVLHKVKYFEKFTIQWQVSEDGMNWLDIDESVNPLYVTYNPPELVNDQPGYAWFHTLLKVGCESAEDQTDPSSIINAIWTKLKTKTIIAADNNKPLFYYKSWDCVNLTTKDLLAGNDGQCGSWARFFIDLLKIQNVQHSTVNDDYFHFSTDLSLPNNGFFVKDWAASTGELTGMWGAVFKYVMIPKYPFTVGQQYSTHYSDLIDNTNSIEGQGPNGNPASIFNNHQITQIEGRLLDPSYGTEFSSLNDIESNAIFGYYIAGSVMMNEYDYDFDNDGQPDDLNNNGIIEMDASVGVILVATDKTVAELQRTPGVSTNH